MTGVEFYGYAVRARAARALLESHDDPFGPVLEQDQGVFDAYALIISGLVEQAASNGDLLEIKRQHQDLFLQLTLEGSRQLQVAAYSLALHDCRTNGNEWACAYVEDSNRSLGIGAAERGHHTSADTRESEQQRVAAVDGAHGVAQSLIPDEMLVHLGRGAIYLRDNVRGMGQREKELLTELADISNRIPNQSSLTSSKDLWIRAAEIFAQLTAGGRMLLNEGMERDTGITADAMLRVKLEEYGHSMPGYGAGKAGCPCSAFVGVFLFLILVAALGFLVL